MKRSFSIFLLIAVLVLSCATTGPGGKKSFIIIPTSQEVSIGAGMAEQVAQTEKVLDDALWQNYLNEVGQKIVSVSDRKDIQFYFTAIESDQINAFAAPGGYIYFYTGLMREMENEAEMAMVLSHEISHVVARHGIKRLQASLGVAAAYELVFGDDSTSALVNTAIGLGLGLVFSGYSRENEREADSYGMHYLVKAGYDPNAGIGMFDKLAALGDEGNGNIFEQLSRSHPETRERITNTRQQIAELKPYPSGLRVGKDKYQRMLKRLPSKENPSNNPGR